MAQTWPFPEITPSAPCPDCSMDIFLCMGESGHDTSCDALFFCPLFFLLLFVNPYVSVSVQQYILLDRKPFFLGGLLSLKTEKKGWVYVGVVAICFRSFFGFWAVSTRYSDHGTLLSHSVSLTNECLFLLPWISGILVRVPHFLVVLCLMWAKNINSFRSVEFVCWSIGVQRALRMDLFDGRQRPVLLFLSWNICWYLVPIRAPVYVRGEKRHDRGRLTLQFKVSVDNIKLMQVINR